MGVAEDGFKIMDLAKKVIEKGNKNAATDGAVAAMAARTAVMAALYNVKINLTAIKDEAFVEKLAQKVKTLEQQVEDKEKVILASIDI
jgi:formiminotetrahydrofolate cyclodeaminase